MSMGLTLSLIPQAFICTNRRVVWAYGGGATEGHWMYRGVKKVDSGTQSDNPVVDILGVLAHGQQVNIKVMDIKVKNVKRA